ncbi:hypothetical protein GCM10011506_31540 [Marivirga lumbricoides]|uniref:Membrane protein insertion efficiency factor YidD n=1 Tax=Marivirga lumbricoides TaxID=1046115 RepID=A0ABQ1MPR8_9BACT|nr:hypothetical protein GCM10011506_31540 [Marivirga lumbricoides]
MLNLLNKAMIILLLYFAFGPFAHAQTFEDDLTLISNSTKDLETVHEETPKKSLLQKINPLRILYNGSLGFYQKNISVQIAANCVFAKTCSHFSKDLTNEFGILGGMVLSIDRLSRCNRISILETSPLNFDEKGKIKESVNDYRF